MSISGLQSIASSDSPLGPMPHNPKERLKKAATALEGIWVTQILKQARPKNSMFGKSFASETFKDMFDQAIGQNMAERGVLGLADSLIRQLMPETSTASTKPKIDSMTRTSAEVPSTIVKGPNP